MWYRPKTKSEHPKSVYFSFLFSFFIYSNINLLGSKVGMLWPPAVLTCGGIQAVEFRLMNSAKRVPFLFQRCNVGRTRTRPLVFNKALPRAGMSCQLCWLQTALLQWKQWRWLIQWHWHSHTHTHACTHTHTVPNSSSVLILYRSSRCLHIHSYRVHHHRPSLSVSVSFPCSIICRRYSGLAPGHLPM